MTLCESRAASITSQSVKWNVENQSAMDIELDKHSMSMQVSIEENLANSPPVAGRLQLGALIDVIGRLMKS